MKSIGAEGYFLPYGQRRTLMRKDRRQAGPKEYLHEQCQPGLPFLIQCPGWLLPSGHKRLTPWFARIFLSLWGRIKELTSGLKERKVGSESRSQRFHHLRLSDPFLSYSPALPPKEWMKTRQPAASFVFILLFRWQERRGMKIRIKENPIGHSLKR